jgi:hypothetical protein
MAMTGHWFVALRTGMSYDGYDGPVLAGVVQKPKEN